MPAHDPHAIRHGPAGLKPNLRMNSSKSCELESGLTKNSPCMI
jgi:hypothetical protein